ncbi:unnamed protein product [Phytophthora lilii]|uniref:Unnamed protein product n=1 Tax=Phytophthora lilii TaxID=2077276 RepID=A0A9W6WY76_9STRA|nr:unnamed protein product [Phytophthora lilii]
MPLESFNHLLSIILPILDRSPHAWLHRDHVLPELKLQPVLDYLAGGPSSDVRRLTGVSHPYFYSILYYTMDAIIFSTELQIKFAMASSEREGAATAFALRSKTVFLTAAWLPWMDGCAK